MNILELCLSPGYGGLEINPHHAAVELARRGHRVTFVARPSTMLAGRLEQDGIPYDALTVRAVHFPLLAARQLARIIDRDAIDVMHVHWRNDIDLAVWAKFFARRRVALAHTRHMQVTRPKRDPYHQFAYGRIDRWIAITDTLAAQIRERLPIPPERIVRLYHGVAEPTPVSPEARAEFVRYNHIPGTGLRIGVFSRIQHIKGQHLVVEAVAKLAAQGIEASATLVGHVMDEAYAESLRNQIAELNISDRVHFAGFVENPTGLMMCFDVVVLPTYGETFGLALAEAMRAGVAVIGTNSQGVPEIIRDGETGLLFEEGDTDGLTAALSQLVANPELRAQLAANGKAFADETFDPVAHYDRLEKILAEVAAAAQ